VEHCSYPICRAQFAKCALAGRKHCCGKQNTSLWACNNRQPLPNLVTSELSRKRVLDFLERETASARCFVAVDRASGTRPGLACQHSRPQGRYPDPSYARRVSKRSPLARGPTAHRRQPGTTEMSRWPPGPFRCDWFATNRRRSASSTPGANSPRKPPQE